MGRLQPETELLDSFETDSVETHANAFESLCRPEPVRVYAAGVSMADHHASLAGRHSGGRRAPVRGHVPDILRQIAKVLLRSHSHELQYLYLHNLYVQIRPVQHRHLQQRHTKSAHDQAHAERLEQRLRTCSSQFSARNDFAQSVAP